MATKSGQQEPEKAEVVEELLDALDIALDRVKVLYEQYFLGIQKQPPTYLHTDVERKIRDITQLQVRNTALRYRFATLQQKFGSYNAYWRRTLRQIESGTYTRNLSKVGRQAARTGAAVPEEILAAMPKRMREQVQRDREAALALDRLRGPQPVSDDQELLTLAEEDADADLDLEPAAFVRESTDVRNVLTTHGAHKIDEADADFDLDAFFARVVNEDAPTPAPDLPVVRVRTPTPQTEPRPRRATDRPPHLRPSPGLASPSAPSRPPTEPPPVQGPPSGTTPVGPPGAVIFDDEEPTPIFLPALRPATVAMPASGSPRIATPPASSATPPAGVVQVVRDSSRAIAPSVASPSAPVSSVTPPAGVAQVARDSSRSIAPSAAIPSAPVSSATPPAGVAQVARDSSRAIPPPVPAAARGAPRVAKEASPSAGRPPLPAAEPVRPPPIKPVLPVMPAPSQATRPSPIAPGASAARAPVAVETLAGPFPRIPSIPPVPPVPPRPRADAAPACVEQEDATERIPAASSPAPEPAIPAAATPVPKDNRIIIRAKPKP